MSRQSNDEGFSAISAILVVPRWCRTPLRNSFEKGYKNILRLRRDT